LKKVDNLYSSRGVDDKCAKARQSNKPFHHCLLSPLVHSPPPYDVFEVTKLRVTEVLEESRNSPGIGQEKDVVSVVAWKGLFVHQLADME
jgi:hypothetical protein